MFVFLCLYSNQNYILLFEQKAIFTCGMLRLALSKASAMSSDITLSWLTRVSFILSGSLKKFLTTKFVSSVKHFRE